ncbi:discoidin domain-containing protein [Aquabacterium sp. OR-4]|uniref:discoidin domain-containing protein n=1 Tax=Aquabacterium sp. OR-4 TaxID=2978127 RepID=UPI0028C7FDCC|nr:discoidin domain-containing protein [Aquabacterium sp. OR-4]MDT7835924.1 discoidin domain-containing protein [Aquabacterium sp. OR-4]
MRPLALTRASAALLLAGAAGMALAAADGRSVSPARTGGATPATGVLDTLRDATPWQATASDQVQARLARDPADGSLCLHYHFRGVSGYAVMRRTLPLDWPAEFSFSARLKGQGATNDVQIKWVDASGDNVWWVNRPAQRLPARLSDWHFRRRHVEFAWGPLADRSLRRTQAIELVVAAGRAGAGGQGRLCLAQLALTPRESDPAVWPEAQQQATPQHLTLDFGRLREFNGLALAWPEGAARVPLRLLASDDGRRWRTLHRLQAGQGRGGLSTLFLPEQQARWLRLQRRTAGPAQQAWPQPALRSARQWPTLDAMLAEQAAALPAGDLPRAYRGQQNHWTLVGVDGGGARSALLSEDGALELGRAGPSLEPALLGADGQRISWAQAQLQHTLREQHLPMPRVHWQAPGLALDIEAAADGPATAPTLLARYTVRNTGHQPQRVTLLLAARPWQVNPPQQFLSTPGGAVPVQRLQWRAGALAIDQRPPLRLLPAPQRVSALPADGGLGLDALLAAPALGTLHDPARSASALMQWPLQLAPGESRSISLLAPLAAGPAPGRAGAAPPTPAAIDARFEAVAAHWRARLNRVHFSVPAEAQPLVDTLRSALAHMLISRDGPALQPGTRSYARSWVRDGAMMVAGLVRLGELAPAREFVDWYAGHIFESGKVPCCVDARGADPVVENDSHGQYLFMLAELWRHGGGAADASLLQRHWPQVQRVVAHLEALRQQSRGPGFQTPARAHLFGLLPPSISHEGYADKPAYAYWDNFWALRGYHDAVAIAQALGQAGPAARWAAARDEFERELMQSVSASARWHGIGWVAGAADRGDFDPSATTVALSPAQAALPPELLAGTFERYWQEAQARADGQRPWKDYTPYELRNVGAMLRLGQPGRAHALLRFFFGHQRPAGWNQWAEVVLPDAREPRFLGDMPHAWVSSDYVRAALDLLAFERGPGPQILIGAGVQPAWRAAAPVGVQGLRTAHGLLDWQLQPRAGGWLLQLPRALPGSQLVLAWPGEGALPQARHQGRLLDWHPARRELPLPPPPAEIELIGLNGPVEPIEPIQPADPKAASPPQR